MKEKKKESEKKEKEIESEKKEKEIESGKDIERTFLFLYLTSVL